MKPAALVATLAVLIAAMFRLAAAAVLAIGLAWLVTGRDPLWLGAAALTWLRTELAIFAGLIVDGWGEWMDRRRKLVEEVE